MTQTKLDHSLIDAGAFGLSLLDTASASSALSLLGLPATYATQTGSVTGLTADRGEFWRFTSTATLGLQAAATLGSSWHLYVRANGGDVVIDPSGSELVDGAATLTLNDGESCILWCTGTEFFTFGRPNYAKGTFTPQLTIGGSSTGIVFVGTPSGRWEKSGDSVEVTMYLRLSSKGGLTGDVVIPNMPFPHVAGSPLSNTGDIQFVSLASAIASLTGRLASGSDDFKLYKSGAVSVAVLGGADITDTTELYIRIRYPFR